MYGQITAGSTFHNSVTGLELVFRGSVEGSRTSLVSSSMLGNKNVGLIFQTFGTAVRVRVYMSQVTLGHNRFNGLFMLFNARVKDTRVEVKDSAFSFNGETGML